MKKIYFISDAHLGLEDRRAEMEKESRLFSFFDTVRADAAELFILGDLFDYWFEYKNVVPKGFHRVLTQLESITRRGVHVHLLVGNHDFWLGKLFTEETGVSVYYDPIAVEFSGKRFFLHHGDGLNEKDKSYRLFRSILRNRMNVFLFRLLHPDLGISLARKTSQRSRDNHSSNGQQSEREALLKFAKLKISEEYDFVILGHAHIPEQLIFGNRQYINLGDWLTHNSYAVFDGDTLSLEYWKFKKDSAV